MTRRLTCHRKVNFDGDELLVLICYEEGFKKEDIKKENRFCKTQEVLIKRGSFYEYIRKKHVITHNNTN